ncbi:hypothetical protein ACFVDI_05685 [Nocardioides sp. NPDC057767]|uniref:hypothetical protein n=1 Tax=unclassified Nocardioides TaxID=2615069 RepID=UPI00367235C5
MKEPRAIAQMAPISELFRGDRVALWATTYNVDLDLFSGYLLGRLGEPPLNVVVLADRDRLDTTLEALPSERIVTLGSVNRRWLLRGVRLGAGVFHPKSYLALAGRSVKLLVGSGNLSTNGLDQGREVFTSFSSGDPTGDAAIRTWVTWMRRIVNELGDTRLAERFTDLETRLPRSDSITVVADSPLWHNLDRALADQFCERVLEESGRIDELIVTAPFYDEAGDALARLLQRLGPTKVTIHMSRSTKVDGNKLASRLATFDVAVATLAYLPEAFTHAKLVGAIAGDRGWLLSGSANLSNAALTFSAGPMGTGNTELAVFTTLTATDLRMTFLPPEVEVEERDHSALTALTFESGSEPVAAPPVRITCATALSDGRVEITTDPALKSTVNLADHTAAQALNVNADGATTVGPLTGPLVHLVDMSGEVVSNRVVVDDPESLRRALRTGERSAGSGRPSELTAADLDTPLGQALLYLHRKVVMDVSEAAGPGGGSDATRAEVSGDDDNDDLWDRLEREKLGRDPRAGAYGRLVGSHSTGDLGDPLIELLDAMRERTPDEALHSPTLLRLISGPLAPENPGTGAPWSTSARVRVRARNVLLRWASVQTDPRLTWVDPLAPLGNLKLIAATFGQLWRINAEPNIDAGLTPDDLDDLWMQWLRPFVGTGQRDGWLDHSALEGDAVRNRLDREFARNVTVLCWLALRPRQGARARIVEWQPVLQAVLSHGLLEVGEDTAEFLAATGHSVSSDDVETDLLEALEFIDDDLWCTQTALDMGLARLELQAVSVGAKTAVRLMIGGISDPLNDPRIPALVAAIGQYRRTETVTAFGTDVDWRLAVRPGDPIYFLPGLNASEVETEPLAPGAIDEIAATNGILADLFPSEVRSAS